MAIDPFIDYWLTRSQKYLRESLASIEFHIYRFLHSDEWLSKKIDRNLKRQSLQSRMVQLFNSVLCRIDLLFSKDSWTKNVLVSVLIIFLIQLISRSAQIAFDLALINYNPFINWILSLCKSTIEFCPFDLYESINSVFIINPSNSYDIRSLLSTMWAVLAALVSFGFVIIIFLMNFINRDGEEATLSLLFRHYAKFNFIVIFGLVSIGSIGITLILLNITNSINQGAIASIIGGTFLLFILNIILITFLFGRAFEFIQENHRRKFIIGLMEKSILREVKAEFTRWIGRKYIMDFCRDSGIGRVLA